MDSTAKFHMDSAPHAKFLTIMLSTLFKNILCRYEFTCSGILVSVDFIDCIQLRKIPFTSFQTH